MIIKPKNNLKRFLILFLITLSSLTSNLSAQSTPAQNIPDFTFYKMNGQPFLRKDLRKDKKIIIVFFDATCEHCQHELREISDRVEQFKNAEFYLVSLDEVGAIQNFMEKYAPRMNGRQNVTILRDLNKQFIIKFLPLQYPALYVFGTNGHIIKYFGQNSNVSDIVSAVNGKKTN